VSQVKLIAEPWDIGDGGYQVGNFPAVWSEWNGQYRDTVRDFWRGEPATVADLASRLTGSSDLYQDDMRSPVASINFVTAHDGFTLADLVSYNDKHNEANGEGGNDGESHNRSWNCGAEGPTDDPDVVRCRRRQARNLLTTLMLSQGVPMLLGGDELGRSQRGNNNAYCQDSDISWYDWANSDEELLEFVRGLISFRREHPVFRRRRWFRGRPIRGAADMRWVRPDGRDMDDSDWDADFGRSLGFLLNGAAIAERDPRGQPITDDSFLIILNAHDDTIVWTLPTEPGDRWRIVIDTSTKSYVEPVGASDPLPVEGRSVMVMTPIER
jgi:glycogen operon protein